MIFQNYGKMHSFDGIPKKPTMKIVLSEKPNFVNLKHGDVVKHESGDISVILDYTGCRPDESEEIMQRAYNRYNSIKDSWNSLSWYKGLKHSTYDCYDVVEVLGNVANV